MEDAGPGGLENRVQAAGPTLQQGFGEAGREGLQARPARLFSQPAADPYSSPAFWLARIEQGWMLPVLFRGRHPLPWDVQAMVSTPELPTG